MDGRQYSGEHTIAVTTARSSTAPAWWEQLDAREAAQVQHAVDYTERFKQAGVPGHGQFILIAKLARQLEAAELAALAAQGRPVVQYVAWDEGGKCWRDLMTGVRSEGPR